MASLAKRIASPGGKGRRLTPLPLVALTALGALGVAAVIYLLWPRWPDTPVAADAPALPIVVAGQMFNVPPAAIRMAVQRHPGPQERVDLVYLWPSLTPPEPGGKPTNGAAQDSERLFVTIADHEGTIAPSERLKIIYPRYTEPDPSSGPDGLSQFGFRDGTPYQGEDLLFDHTAPERFLVRCSRAVPPTPGACLYERYVGEASVTVRFARELLPEWRLLASGFEKLIGQLRAGGA
jgi:hypothetical protein